jgi:hypothetical protein
MDDCDSGDDGGAMPPALTFLPEGDWGSGIGGDKNRSHPASGAPPSPWLMRLAAVAAVLALRLDDARRGFAKSPGPAAAQDVAAARQQQATSLGLILLGLVRLAFSACRAAVRSAFLLFLVRGQHDGGRRGFSLLVQVVVEREKKNLAERLSLDPLSRSGP